MTNKLAQAKKNMKTHTKKETKPKPIGPSSYVRADNMLLSLSRP